MAICDHRYRFMCIDVGAQGRQSDSGVFANSTMGRRFADEQMNMPPPMQITPGGPVLPCTLLGDAAFGLKEWLTTPYPGKSTEHMPVVQKIFNYRQSRARRVIENSFGILVARWRILKTALEVAVPTAEKIVKASVCLHNFCMMEQENVAKHQRAYQYVTPQMLDRSENSVIVEAPSCGLDNIQTSRSRNPTLSAKRNREQIADFFMNEGEVSWQWNAISEAL